MRRDSAFLAWLSSAWLSTGWLPAAALGLSLFALADLNRASAGEGTAAAKKPADKLVALDPKGIVQLDHVGKRLLVKTHVVLREGFLEMLCCPAQTKEHESILAVDGKAYVIHAGLLALGAKTGAPVQYQPTFHPATGQPVDIFLQWADADGKPHRVKAQEWIRYATHRYFVVTMDQLPAGLTLPDRDDALPIRFFPKFKQLTWFGPMSAQQREKLLTLSRDAAYRKAIATFFDQSQSRQLDAGWVFVGSGWYVDERTGKKAYIAEGGDLICVSNFPDAMLDLAIKSTDKQDEGLLFEAWTERIPPRGTDVTMELVPRVEKRRDQ
ncbi:MAG TPA: YdjY domain-containing protein [Planctomycetaceae bacterium]|jgi:hypothetical protein|nr:YdjY domain-containing protein [Planctomycetaceae bacterium]